MTDHLSSEKFDYLVLEYCQYGDLFDIILKNGALPERIAKKLFLQLLDAVEHLHLKLKIAHLDIKLENILIGDNFKLKLCDFGFIEDLSNRILKRSGTDGYRAPEVYHYNNEGFEGDKADIFALGVVLFIMIFGMPPFSMAT